MPKAIAPTTADRIRSADELLETVEASGLVGTWRWDFAVGAISWSKGLFRLLGLDPATVQPSVSTWQDLVHPEDRRDISDPAFVFAETTRTDRTARLLRPDGSLRFIRSFSEVIRKRDGTPKAVQGVSFDVSEAEALRSDLRRTTGQLQVLAAIADAKVWSYVRGKTTTPGEDLLLPEAILQRTASSDRAQVLAAWEGALKGRESTSISHRGDEVETAFVSHMRPLPDARGNADIWVGVTVPDTAQPISARSHSPPPWALRAARVALGWTAAELARRADVSFSTVRRAEAAGGTPPKGTLLGAIAKALESGGALFGTDRDGRVTLSVKSPTGPT